MSHTVVQIHKQAQISIIRVVEGELSSNQSRTSLKAALRARHTSFHSLSRYRRLPISPSLRVSSFVDLIAPLPSSKMPPPAFATAASLRLSSSPRSASSSPVRASASPQRTPSLSLSRRSLLALALAIPLPALAGIQTTMSDGGYASPSDAASLASRAGGAEVDMPTFRAMLQRKEITRVWFFGVVNDRCFFEDKAGKVAKIGDGYPLETSGSPESPLWVMAQVRDHNVPYTMSPIESKVG